MFFDQRTTLIAAVALAAGFPGCGHALERGEVPALVPFRFIVTDETLIAGSTEEEVRSAEASLKFEVDPSAGPGSKVRLLSSEENLDEGGATLIEKFESDDIGSEFWCQVFPVELQPNEYEVLDEDSNQRRIVLLMSRDLAVRMSADSEDPKAAAKILRNSETEYVLSKPDNIILERSFRTLKPFRIKTIARITKASGSMKCEATPDGAGYYKAEVRNQISGKALLGAVRINTSTRRTVTSLVHIGSLNEPAAP